MHDIKYIKENKKDFEKSMKKRNLKINVNDNCKCMILI